MTGRLVMALAAALAAAIVFMAYGGVELQALWFGGALLCR